MSWRMEWLMCISLGKMTYRCMGQYQCGSLAHLNENHGKNPWQ